MLSDTIHMLKIKDAVWPTQNPALMAGERIIKKNCTKSFWLITKAVLDLLADGKIAACERRSLLQLTGIIAHTEHTEKAGSPLAGPTPAASS